MDQFDDAINSALTIIENMNSTNSFESCEGAFRALSGIRQALQNDERFVAAHDRFSGGILSMTEWYQMEMDVFAETPRAVCLDCLDEIRRIAATPAAEVRPKTHVLSVGYIRELVFGA